MQKKRYLATILTGIGVIVAGALFRPKSVIAQTERAAAVFTSDGKLELPTGFRRWVFVGAPLTPHGFNNGKAGFPEYNDVYIQAQNVDADPRTGSFPEGTVIVKQLIRVLNPTFPEASRTEPSGRGFFNGEFNGIDVTVKDSKRFSKTNGWGFFTFCHHPEPYETTASEVPRDHVRWVSQKLCCQDRYDLGAVLSAAPWEMTNPSGEAQIL